MIEISVASTEADLKGIRRLQEANLRKNLSESEALNEGFVLAEFNIEFLETISTKYPITIAKDEEGCIVGYALAVSKESHCKYESLDNKLQKLNEGSYNGIILQDQPYILCAQLCVAVGYRGRGLMGQLYKGIQSMLRKISPGITLCVADVAVENTRSLRAHEKIGFKIFDSMKIQGTTFNILIWDWSIPKVVTSEE